MRNWKIADWQLLYFEKLYLTRIGTAWCRLFHCQRLYFTNIGIVRDRISESKRPRTYFMTTSMVKLWQRRLAQVVGNWSPRVLHASAASPAGAHGFCVAGTVGALVFERWRHSHEKAKLASRGQQRAFRDPVELLDGSRGVGGVQAATLAPISWSLV